MFSEIFDGEVHFPVSEFGSLNAIPPTFSPCLKPIGSWRKKYCRFSVALVQLYRVSPMKKLGKGKSG